MGDANSVLNDPELRHLMRRAGFGTTSKDVLKILKRGLTRGQVVDLLLGFKPKGLKASGNIDEVYDRWLEYMLKAKFAAPREARALLARPLLDQHRQGRRRAADDAPEPRCSA